MTHPDIIQGSLPVPEVAGRGRPIARLPLRTPEVAVVVQQHRHAARDEGLGERVQAHVLLTGQSMRGHNNRWAPLNSLPFIATAVMLSWQLGTKGEANNNQHNITSFLQSSLVLPAMAYTCSCIYFFGDILCNNSAC